MQKAIFPENPSQELISISSDPPLHVKTIKTVVKTFQNHINSGITTSDNGLGIS